MWRRIKKEKSRKDAISSLCTSWTKQFSHWPVWMLASEDRTMRSRGSIHSTNGIHNTLSVIEMSAGKYHHRFNGMTFLIHRIPRPSHGIVPVAGRVRHDSSFALSPLGRRVMIFFKTPGDATLVLVGLPLLP